MNPHIVLLQSPLIDFDTLLTVAQQALGYNVASAVDASPVKRADAERFLSCLATMQDRRAKPGLAPHLLSHVSLSVLLIADEDGFVEILEVCEMPFVCVPTVSKNVSLAVISGTLAQWREAIERGSSQQQSTETRVAFDRVKGVFLSAGLNVWKDARSQRLLEGRR